MSWFTEKYRKFKLKDRIRKKVDDQQGFLHMRVQSILRKLSADPDNKINIPENAVIKISDKIMDEFKTFIDKVL